MIENNWSNRLFLLTNTLANDVLNIEPQNFLQLIEEEENGRIFNAQMTGYFYRILERLCDVSASESSDILMDWQESELMNLTADDIKTYFNKYVLTEDIQLLKAVD